MRQYILILIAFSWQFAGFAQYDTVYSEKNGYRKVRVNGLYGSIDANGKLVIPATYKTLFNFNANGRALAQNTDGKCGVINVSNKAVIPLKYINVFGYKNNYFTVIDKDSMFGVYNQDGKITIPIEYDWIYAPNGKGNFIVNKEGKCGLLSPENKILIPIELHAIYNASNGFHVTVLKKSSSRSFGYYYSEAGVEIGQIQADGRDFTPDGIAGTFSMDGKFGYIDTTGNPICEFEYTDGTDFKDGKAFVINGTEIGELDKTGNYTSITGKIPYDHVSDKYTWKEYKIAMLADHVGITNAQGDNIIPPIYSNFNDLDHGLFIAKRGDMWGVLSMDNKEIVPFIYEHIGEIMEGPQGNMFYIKRDGLYGLLKTDGTLILKPKYNEIGEYANNFYRFDAPGADVYVNARGDVFTQPMYDEYVKQTAAKQQTYDYSQESTVQSIQDTYNKIQEAENAENESKPLKNLIRTSELNYPVAIETTAKMYNLTSVDTLYFKNSNNKMLAMKRSGNDFHVLGTYLETITNGYAAIGGFTIDKLSKTASGYEFTKGPVFAKADWSKGSQGISYNTFQLSDGKYIVCSQLGITAFNSDGTIISSTYNINYRFISAVSIPNSKEVVLLGISNNASLITIFTYNYETQKFGTAVPIRSLSDSRMILSPLSTKLLYTPDNHLLLAFYLDESNQGNSNQYIAKLSLDKVKAGDSDIFLWWGQFDYARIRHAEINSNGKLSGILASNASLIHIEGDPLAKSFDEFDKSLTLHSTPEKNQTTNREALVFPIQNNEWITVSDGNYEDGYDASLSICYYNSKMQLVRQYRIPTHFEDFPTRKFTTRLGDQFGFLVRYDESTYAKDGISSYFYQDLLTNADHFHKHEMEYGIYHVTAGDKPGEIYLMTGTAILKIDLNKYKECPLKYVEAESNYNSDDDSGSDYSSSSSDSQVKSNNSGKDTKPAAKTTCTIINDLKPEQQNKYGHVKLIFRNFNIVTKSIARSHTYEVPCDDVIVYKELKENSTEPGAKLFETKGRCGEVIKLSEFW